MISAQHSSNNGKNKVTRKASWYESKKERIENIDIELTPRARNKSLLQIKQTLRVIVFFVEDTRTHALSIFTSFDINFLENAPREMYYGEMF